MVNPTATVRQNTYDLVGNVQTRKKTWDPEGDENFKLSMNLMYSYSKFDSFFKVDIKIPNFK